MKKFLSLFQPRKVTTLPSNGDKNKYRASNYAIGRNKRNVAIATFKDKKLYISGGTSLAFLGGANYDSGILPDIAMNAGGVVIEVHESQSWNNLYCTVGSIAANGAITFGSAKKYTSGILPSVAVNTHNVVVEVHQSESSLDSTIWYLVGRVNGGAISFGDSVKFDDGLNPQVAINGNGVVVAAHLTSNAMTNTLYYHVGIADPDKGKIDFGPSISYDSGRCPHVAITDDDYVIEVHKSQSYDTLWYRLGLIDVAIRKITWLTPDAVHFADGTNPSVSISNGRVSIIYYHKGSVYTIDGLLVSPSWMADEFQGSSLKLNEIAFPGSHDAGMYEAKSCTLGGGSCNTVTQIKTLYDQLVHGSRYFDLRPVIRGGELELGHYSRIPLLGYQGCSGEKLGAALSEVARFAAGSSDLIVLKFSHYINLDTGKGGFNTAEFQLLVGVVRNVLVNYMYHERWNASLGSTPIQDLMRQGQATVLCVFEGISPSDAWRAQGVYAYKDFGGTGRADLVVYDEYSKTNDLNTMVPEQLSRLRDPANRSPSSLFLLSWTLTQSDLQASTCTSFTGTSILDLAKIANDALYVSLVPRISNGNINRGVIPNVVYVDAYDANALNICYLLNTYLQ